MLAVESSCCSEPAHVGGRPGAATSSSCSVLEDTNGTSAPTGPKVRSRPVLKMPHPTCPDPDDLGRGCSYLRRGPGSWATLAPAGGETRWAPGGLTETAQGLTRPGPNDRRVRRPSIVVPFGRPLLAGAIGLGILVNEVPPGEDGEHSEPRPLCGVHPTEAVSRESTCHLPPSGDQTPGSEQEELDVKQECPAREPALPHGMSVDAVRRQVAWMRNVGRPSAAVAVVLEKTFAPLRTPCEQLTTRSQSPRRSMIRPRRITFDDPRRSTTSGPLRDRPTPGDPAEPRPPSSQKRPGRSVTTRPGDDGTGNRRGLAFRAC
jgi:hypothetical protein